MKPILLCLFLLSCGANDSNPLTSSAQAVADTNTGGNHITTTEANPNALGQSRLLHLTLDETTFEYVPDMVWEQEYLPEDTLRCSEKGKTFTVQAESRARDGSRVSFTYLKALAQGTTKTELATSKFKLAFRLGNRLELTAFPGTCKVDFQRSGNQVTGLIECAHVNEDHSFDFRFRCAL